MGNLTFMILLIAAGILFILAELLLFPGMGVSGILGLASMGGACYYAYANMGTGAFVTVTAICLVIVIATVAYALRAKTWQKLALDTSIKATVADGAPAVEAGQRGRAETRLAPAGTVRFGASAIEARSVSGMIDAGTEVEVTAVEDNRIYVKPVNQ